MPSDRRLSRRARMCSGSRRSVAGRSHGRPPARDAGWHVGPYVFPLDAEYDIRVELLKNRDGSFYVTEPNELEVSVDGERVALFKVMPPRRRARAADKTRTTPRSRTRTGSSMSCTRQGGAARPDGHFRHEEAAADETLRQPFLRVYNASYVRFMVAVGTSRFPVRSTRCLPATRLAGGASSHVRRRTLPARTAPATSSRRWRSAPSGARESSRTSAN